MSVPSSFRFSLERVRSLRQRTEDAAKEALAGAMQDQQRSERDMQEAAEAMLRAREAQLTAAGSGPLKGHDLLAHQAYLERSEQAHRVSQEILGRSELVVETRRGELTEAARDRQALDRLEEHRRFDHAREVARQENLELDEIALNSYRRRVAA